MPESSEKIQDLFIEEEIKDSYLNYAMSVIVSRALPDVRDGLKPSQRRILIAMHDLSLGPTTKFRKCAKIAGDTSGNYHPHGEQVIYPTLVRLAQDFNMRYPLIQGQGNFGSIDGDQAAAMRYTEGRLTHISMHMLEDLDKETVEFIPNYDNTRFEPAVLPSKIPNMIINGAIGIAVGMSTSIPPHNLREVCDGVVQILENPDISIAELNRIIQGPDFPTGAVICGRKEIREAYETGRSIITVRAKVHTEVGSDNRTHLVFTEIPYQVNKARTIEHIAELVKEGKINGIHDIRDESDRKEQVRIVVELKHGENEEVVLNQLYKYSPLQSSISIIMIALINGRPRTLNLKEILVYFIEHRREVIRRRTSYLLDKVKKRAHIVEGLLIALKSIESVLDVIRKSPDSKDAKKNLMEKFNMSQEQCDAILQMRLATLTGLEVDKLTNENESLIKDIENYQGILASSSKVDEIIKSETVEIKNKYGDERRTDITGEIEDIELEDLIPDEQCLILVTHEGYIKRTQITEYRMQQRYGTGITAASLKEGDFVEHLFTAATHDFLLFFTNKGKVYAQKVYEIPKAQRTAKGRAIVNILNFEENEEVTSLIPVREFDERWLVMATSNGVIKKTALSLLKHIKKGGLRAITLDEEDYLIRVVITQGNQDIVLGTEFGKAIRFNEKKVRPMGRVARGVRGCRLLEKDKVVDMIVVDEKEALLTVCDNGHGKRTPYPEYRITNRGTQGVANVKRTDENVRVVALKSVKEDDQLVFITSTGMAIRIFASDIRVTSRAAQGVRLIKLKPGDKLVSVAKLAQETIPPGDGTGEMEAFEGIEKRNDLEENLLSKELETNGTNNEHEENPEIHEETPDI